MNTLILRCALLAVPLSYFFLGPVLARDALCLLQSNQDGRFSALVECLNTFSLGHVSVYICVDRERKVSEAGVR